MANRLMYIPNDATQNYLFCRLELVVETFGHLTLWTKKTNRIKAPKFIKQTNKKTLFKNLGD